MKTSNNEHRTLNIECFCKSADAGNSMLDVRCSAFDVFPLFHSSA